MKRRICAALILTAALVVASGALTPAAAQTNESTTQMQLVASPAFLVRLQYVGWQIAKDVLAEVHNGASATPIAYTAACHDQRAAYARSWMQNPAQSAANSAVAIVGTNEAGAVIVGTVNGTATDSTANDLSLKQAYRWNWNALSLCDTGS